MIIPIYSRSSFELKYFPYWEKFKQHVERTEGTDDYEGYIKGRNKLLAKYGAKLITSSKFETQLKFKTEEHCSLFLLKFS